MSNTMTSASRRPTARDENWKYANLRALERVPFEDPTTAAVVLAEPTSAQTTLDDIALPARQAKLRVVLVDGVLNLALSDPLPDTVQIKPARQQTLETAGISSIDRYFFALNQRRRQQTLELRVAAATQLELEILCIARSVAQPALELHLAADSRLRLIERHLSAETSTGTADSATNLAIEIKLAKRARLDWLRWHRLAGKARHIETLDLELSEAADCELVQLTTGQSTTDAVSSRSTAFVRHNGAAHLRWNVAALADGSQSHDAYVHIEHAAPGAQTEQVFRGIASGRGRLGFNGHMRVNADAIGTRSEQSLKSLLAGGEAEANVRPQLEIYTDAVSASHGATVGKLDIDMLFYLLSRGIEPATAESLLKWAFISDVLARLSDSDLRHEIEASLVSQLPGAIAARGQS